VDRALPEAPEPRAASLRRAEVADPRLQALLARWRAAGAAGRLPPRAALDPVDLADMAGDLLLVELEPPLGRFRAARVGTSYVLWFRRDITGCLLDELSGHPYFRLFVEALTGALLEERPLSLAAAVPDGGRMAAYEALLLPLADDGRRVDAILVACRRAPARTPMPVPA